MQSLLKAKKYGYITVFILLISFIGQIALTVLLPEEFLLGQIFITVTTLLLTYTYLVLMRGISVIAAESKNEQFIKATKQYITVIISTSGILAFYGLAIVAISNSLFTFIATSLMLLCITLLGFVSLRIAKGFESIIPVYGKSARRATYWHKIAGWLIVTVILNSIGILVSLIADYYMWRVINQRIDSTTEGIL